MAQCRVQPFSVVALLEFSVLARSVINRTSCRKIHSQFRVLLARFSIPTPPRDESFALIQRPTSLQACDVRLLLNACA